MARNEEKAQSMLNGFIALKSEEKKKPEECRPYLASESRDLSDADKWRQQIMRGIGLKVAEHSAKMTDLEGNIIDVPKPRGCGSGYRGEEDGILEKVEGPAEEDRRVFAVEWRGMEAIRKEARKGAKEVVSVGVGVGAEVLFEEEEDVVEEERERERERERGREEIEREFVVHVPIDRVCKRMKYKYV
ncbi:hypothetical protein DKX38_025193 [Salix brachista]|uniref:Uncharacterized protein n=1 Tax=Salix brachista TaxID=2182728 RepID=A0A5N5JS59_9ROSI|nr:hypothetical protein DKX38_025193 [Salix brachista]